MAALLVLPGSGPLTVRGSLVENISRKQVVPRLIVQCNGPDKPELVLEVGGPLAGGSPARVSVRFDQDAPRDENIYLEKGRPGVYSFGGRKAVERLFDVAGCS